MSFFKKLFGGGGDKAEAKAATQTYEGFRITATPLAEGTAFRVAATIEKDVGGETKIHNLVRADTIAGREDAEAACFRKAKQVIDEQGERIFR